MAKRNYKGKSITLNITPFILKTVLVVTITYIIYCLIFLNYWRILPYTFNYTLYITQQGYDEYNIEKGDILVIKRVDRVVGDDLVIERIGTNYKITKGVRRPYGVVVNRVGSGLEKLYK